MHAAWRQDRTAAMRRTCARLAKRAGKLLLAAVATLGAGSAAATDLTSGGHVWVLGVNGSLSAREPGSLKSGSQAPDAGALAVSGNRRRLFGMESAIGRIFEINTRTLASTPVMELKQPLSGICANPDGSRVMLASQTKKTLQLVDTTAKQALPVPVEAKAFKSCQFSPDGSHAYVTASDADELLIVDIKGNKLLGKIAAPGAKPSKIVDVFVHPNPAKRFALVLGASQLWYLDTASHKLTGAEISLGVPIQSITFHPDGAHFFAIARDKVFLVDLQTRATQKTFELTAGAWFRGAAVDAQGKRLFVAGNHETDGGVGAILNKEGKEFAAIDLETGKRTYQAFPPVQTVLFIVTP